MKSQPAAGRSLVLLLILMSAFFVLDISLGSVRMPYAEFLSALSGSGRGTVWHDILWDFRIPKAITCVIAGAGLSCAGLMMQSWFRNPLAGPDVLGLSSGASLFVAVIILAGAAMPEFFLFLTHQPWSVAIAASAGSTLVFVIMLTVAQKVRSNTSLLILGIMLSALTASIVSILQFLSRAEELQSFMVWSMGSVGNSGWPEIRAMTVALGVGICLAALSTKGLNALLLGENYAKTLGINVRKTRFIIVLATGILAGSVTAFCGPIAFVGLAVPHLIKSVVNTSNHKIMIPAVMLGGALLLLFCDMLAQLPGSVQILPLNSVTSLIGAPVIFWIVIRARGIRD